MASLYITELTNVGFHKQADAHSPPAQIAILPAVNSQKLTIGAGSVQSAAFDFKTNYVRLHADATCSIEVGINPTATTNGLRLAANVPEYFGLQTTGLILAVIANT